MAEAISCTDAPPAGSSRWPQRLRSLRSKTNTAARKAMRSLLLCSRSRRRVSASSTRAASRFLKASRKIASSDRHRARALTLTFQCRRINDDSKARANERSKRHPRALRADVRREQARQAATGEPHREPEPAGQLALGLESLA